jgi:hypothetical protein
MVIPLEITILLAEEFSRGMVIPIGTTSSWTLIHTRQDPNAQKKIPQLLTIPEA